MLTLYLTVTLCMIDKPDVCKEYYQKMQVPTPHACIISGMTIAKNHMNGVWKLARLRCSRKQEFGI